MSSAAAIAAGVPAAVDRAFPQLFAWLGQHGVEPTGPPFIRYHEVDDAGEPLGLDVGAPLPGHHEGGGAVRADILPAGRYITQVHVGPYTHATVPDLGGARDALRDWIETRAIASGCLIEHYRVGPPLESDWTKWETELACLIVEE
jgi:hypothetical protein